MTEDDLEQPTLSWFLGICWRYCYARDIVPDGGKALETIA